MKLPEELEKYVGTGDLIDRSGHSPAKVYETPEGYFVKCDEPGELAREYGMTKLFHGLGAGAEAVRYLTLDRDYLVTRKVPGRDLTKDLSDPVHICHVLADALRKLHGRPVDGSIPVSSRYARYMASAAGPFSGGQYDPSVYMDGYRLSSRQEAWEIMQRGKHLLQCDTLIHGDACLPVRHPDPWGRLSPQLHGGARQIPRFHRRRHGRDRRQTHRSVLGPLVPAIQSENERLCRRVFGSVWP